MKPLQLFALLLSLGMFSYIPLAYGQGTYKNYALFFAVNEYQNSQMIDLVNPVKNANDIAAELSSKYNFHTKVVENPTLDEVEQKLKEYQEQFANGSFDPNGQFFLFFSGHGVKNFNNGYWMPADVDPEKPHRTALAYDIWRPRIDAFNCQHILVAIDACFSIMFDPNWQSRSSGSYEGDAALAENQRLIQNHKAFKSRIYFTSDGEEEQTPDKSSFAKKILEGFRTYSGQQGILTSGILYGVYLKKALPVPGGGHFGQHDDEACFLFMRDGYKPEEAQIEDMMASDLNAWQEAKTLDNEASYELYLAQFPNGEFKALALAKLKEKASLDADGLPIAKDPAGKIYKTVRLNGKVWMAENLNYNTYDGAWCYDNNIDNCNYYGRLYTLEAAQKACTALGEGWRLPTIEEWNALRDSRQNAFKELKEGGSSGFGALLGGKKNYEGQFMLKNSSGNYWTSSVKKANRYWYVCFRGAEMITRIANYAANTWEGHSCRCIHD